MMYQCNQCTAQSWGQFTDGVCDTCWERTKNAPTDHHTPRAYALELARLRPQDEVQHVTPAGSEPTVGGTYFITTASHGYLAVPASHPWSREARTICSYGYQGRRATYLEEDCEAPAFIRRVTELEAAHHAPVAA